MDIAEMWLTGAGYKIMTRAEFETATDLPPGLKERAAKYTGGFVVYDPSDDDEGFMLIRDDRKTVIEDAVEHLAN